MRSFNIRSKIFLADILSSIQTMNIRHIYIIYQKIYIIMMATIHRGKFITVRRARHFRSVNFCRWFSWKWQAVIRFMYYESCQSLPPKLNETNVNRKLFCAPLRGFLVSHICFIQQAGLWIAVIGAEVPRSKFCGFLLNLGFTTTDWLLATMQIHFYFASEIHDHQHDKFDWSKYIYLNERLL